MDREFQEDMRREQQQQHAREMETEHLRDQLSEAVAQLAAANAQRDELQRQNDEAALFLSVHYGLGEGSIVERFRALRKAHESMALEAKEDGRKIVSLEVQRDELLRAAEPLCHSNYGGARIEQLRHAVETVRAAVRNTKVDALDKELAAIARAQSGQPAQRDDDGTASGGGAQ